MQPYDCRNDQSKIVDAAQLRDILSVIRCTIILLEIDPVIIVSQYTVSRYNHFHPNASRPPSFRATTIHVIIQMNDVAPSHFGAFRQYVMAYISIYKFWTFRARLPDLSSPARFPRFP
jgi:hypothetical protein